MPKIFCILYRYGFVSIEHLKVQEAFQQFNSSSTSKTINMPNNATIDDVKNIYVRIKISIYKM